MLSNPLGHRFSFSTMIILLRFAYHGTSHGWDMSIVIQRPLRIFEHLIGAGRRFAEGA